MQALLHEISYVGQGASRRMCKNIMLLGDFNTRFQYEVPNVIMPSAVDISSDYHTHRVMQNRTDELVTFMSKNGFRVGSSEFDLGPTRHSWNNLKSLSEC
eukprot:190779-Karenia_brevis.AAC.1